MNRLGPQYNRRCAMERDSNAVTPETGAPTGAQINPDDALSTLRPIRYRV